ncbi:MAG: reductive dehalogenase [Candidatus Odinarchaeota archaeon]
MASALELAMTIKQNRKQLEKNFLSGNIPFALDKTEYQRFSERDTIFARVMWDESFEAYQQPISKHAPKKVGKKGYSREGYALRDAAWTIYDYFPRALLKKIDGNGGKDLDSIDVVPSLPDYGASNLKKNAELVKRVACMFGAVDVGICEMEPDQPFIYTHDRRGEPIVVPETVKYAIVMLVEMDHYGIGTSPAIPSGIATGHGYSQMMFAIAVMGEFLRNLGYRAISAGNDIGLSVPLAIKAGLGQVGRNGLLINRKYGQRVRICKVFTDFPMEVDEPVDLGAVEVCTVCKKCAEHCPSKSIPFDKYPAWESPWDTPSNNSGGTYKWYVNVDSCYKYWVANSSDCSNCIRACPFTKPIGRFMLSHDMARFFINHFRFLDRLWVMIDNLMGIWPWRYGKQRDAGKFWKNDKYLGRKVKKS